MDQFVKSRYEGDLVNELYHGNGTYFFENGTQYIGEFCKGHFHGKGKILYKNGDIIEGTWLKGEIIEKKLIFHDGLEYMEENWDYCINTDRRFYNEKLTEIQPLDKTLFSNDPNGLKDIKPGHYGLLKRHSNRSF